MFKIINFKGLSREFICCFMNMVSLFSQISLMHIWDVVIANEYSPGASI